VRLRRERHHRSGAGRRVAAVGYTIRRDTEKPLCRFPPGFTDYALELFAGVGRVEADGKFGRVGLFRDGVMFVCLDDDVIHVHVDDDLQAELQTQASAP